MPRWDYRCPGCFLTRIDVRLSNWREATDHAVFCDCCGRRMERVPSAANFTIQGYNAANSYGVKK